MNIVKFICHSILAVFLITSTKSAIAQNNKNDDDDKGILSLVIENDSFAGSDHDYTSGIRLSWISSEDKIPKPALAVANLLPLSSSGNKRISMAIGQSMYTPKDITDRTPSPDDHPYAGWLYGSVGMVSDTGNTLDNVMLTLGVVGPLALARQSQSFIHSKIGSPHPRGWHNQLHNEPGVILTYERKWRGLYEVSPFGMGIDITPHAGVNLGNINTDAAIGATLRVGYDLPSDYGPPRIRPSLPGSDFFVPTKQLSGYLFTTISERFVARNIFLDGNTFSDSPSVDKKYLVSSLQAGAAITYEQMRLSYTQVYMTKEYETQDSNSVFGALTLSLRF